MLTLMRKFRIKFMTGLQVVSKLVNHTQNTKHPSKHTQKKKKTFFNFMSHQNIFFFKQKTH
jgi:hypothetical protein